MFFSANWFYIKFTKGGGEGGSRPLYRKNQYKSCFFRSSLTPQSINICPTLLPQIEVYYPKIPLIRYFSENSPRLKMKRKPLLTM